MQKSRTTTTKSFCFGRTYKGLIPEGVMPMTLVRRQLTKVASNRRTLPHILSNLLGMSKSTRVVLDVPTGTSNLQRENYINFSNQAINLPTPLHQPTLTFTVDKNTCKKKRRKHVISPYKHIQQTIY